MITLLKYVIRLHKHVCDRDYLLTNNSPFDINDPVNEQINFITHGNNITDHTPFMPRTLRSVGI